MKRNPLTLVVGAIVVLVFAAMMFAFQVRESQVALVTTFGRYTGGVREPGLHFRLPWPIQTVYRFDDRVRNYEKKFEETTTSDGKLLLLELFIGWRIADPKTYLERFGNSAQQADQALESLMRDAKNSIIGEYPLSALISTNAAVQKFGLIQTQMLQRIKPKALSAYGIDVVMLGFKQIGFPQSITSKVFTRMRSEREEMVSYYKGQGEQESLTIRANADRERQQILADAQSRATQIKGAGDAAAATVLKTFKLNPKLAVFLLKLNALEEALKNRGTVVLGPETPPFDLLRQQTGLISIPTNSVAPPLRLPDHSHPANSSKSPSHP